MVNGNLLHGKYSTRFGDSMRTRQDTTSQFVWRQEYRRQTCKYAKKPIKSQAGQYELGAGCCGSTQEGHPASTEGSRKAF